MSKFVSDKQRRKVMATLNMDSGSDSYDSPYRTGNKLPEINYKDEKYYVDFRLGELRNTKTAKSIPFTSLKEDKYSDVKKELRRVRFRTWHNDYIRGVDD